MKVIKRDGTEVPFDLDKIQKALFKADEAVRESGGEGALSTADILTMAAAVELRCGKLARAVGVEEIQDMIIDELDKGKHYRVARVYSEYRLRHELLRQRGRSAACGQRRYHIVDVLHVGDSAENDERRIEDGLRHLRDETEHQSGREELPEPAPFPESAP